MPISSQKQTIMAYSVGRELLFSTLPEELLSLKTSKITNKISTDIKIDIPPVPHSVNYSVVFIQKDASAKIQYGEYAEFAAR